MLLGLFILGKRSHKSPVLRRAMGAARVLAYGAAVSLGLGFFTMRSAIADFRERSLEVGHDIAGLTDLLGTTAEIRINGQPMYISTAETDQPVNAVLDRFEANCNDHAGTMAEVLKSIEANPNAKEAIKSRGLTGLGVQRAEAAGGGSGSVICLANADGARVDWKDAVQTLKATGDVGALGNFRYAYAEKQKSGKTAIRTIWTEGHFNLYAVMPPEKGDAPGGDEPSLPRPDDARRLFTATATNTSYAARIYETNDTPAKALDSYDAKMTKLGWERVALTDTMDDTHWYVNPKTLEQSVFEAKHDDQRDNTSLVVGTIGIAPANPSERQAK